jgi:hypothetical protein
MQKINVITVNRKDLSTIGCSYDPTIDDGRDYRDEVAQYFFEKLQAAEKDGILKKSKEAPK